MYTFFLTIGDLSKYFGIIFNTRKIVKQKQQEINIIENSNPKMENNPKPFNEYLSKSFQYCLLGEYGYYIILSQGNY